MEIMLQHYHTGTTLSDRITASIEALQLEIGSRGNPLNDIFLSVAYLPRTAGQRQYGNEHAFKNSVLTSAT
jgi:hypothetical protein